MYAYFQIYAEAFAATLIWVGVKDALKKHGKAVSYQGTVVNDLLTYGIFLVLIALLLPSDCSFSTGLMMAFVLIAGGGTSAVFLGYRSRPLPLLELGAAFLIVKSGILIQFFSSPLGGYLYLDRASYPLTILWLFFLTQLLKTANRLPGLFSGLIALFSYLLVGALLTQRVASPEASILAVALAGATTSLWVTGLINGPVRLASPAASIWALTAAAVSVVGTSKKVAFISVLTPVLLIVTPLIFFTILISVSYLAPKVSKAETRVVFEWSLTDERLVNVVMIFCLVGNLVLLSHLYVDSMAWSIGLSLVGLTVFLQTARLILIKGKSSTVVSPEAPTVGLFGIPFITGGMAAASLRVRKYLSGEKPSMIITPDALALLGSLADSYYAHILGQADMVIPDGAGVVWAADFLTEQPALTRTPGIELVDEILRIADRDSLNVYLLGTTDEVLLDAVAEIKTRHKGLTISGHHNGFFSEEDNDEIVKDISDSKAHILLVAMGVPMQEKWMHSNREKLSVKLMIGCGGSLDVMAGHVVRAPEWLQTLGLEWMWRVIREPARIKRILLLPVFVFQVFREKVRNARRSCFLD
jgi:N-acetylglucosaminyldiphosphoundecaprenol N-acetyl-beta-D-mannosaminyltransferase